MAKRKYDEVELPIASTSSNGLCKKHQDKKDRKEKKRSKRSKSKKSKKSKDKEAMNSSPSKIHLRHDQFDSFSSASTSSNVTIYGPSWIKKRLRRLGKEFDGHKFEILEQSNTPVGELRVKSKKLGLRELQMIARNEPKNASGDITFDNYNSEIREEYILSLKDLVRQTVIIGLDRTVAHGGFNSRRWTHEPKVDVVVIDLSALEFKKPWNTGRLVLFSEDNQFPTGIYDSEIYFKIVGEPCPTLSKIRSDESGRFVYHSYQRAWFDTFAYKKFVAYDVLLTGLALEDFAKKHDLMIHFKFLAYGTGHFAKGYKDVLIANLVPGIFDGLELLFSKLNSKGPISRIHNVELPFYDHSCTYDPDIQERIKNLCKKYHVDVWFTECDALENTVPHPLKKYTIATTNCANPHAALGNCMSHRSIDGSIAENLESRGNLFSPILNKEMGEKWMDIKLPKKVEVRSRNRSSSSERGKENSHRRQSRSRSPKSVKSSDESQESYSE